MKGRNINARKKDISILAKTIKSIKEDNYENDFDDLNIELYPKASNKSFKRNSSLKILAYNQKKYFPSKENNSKKYINLIFNKLF